MKKDISCLDEPALVALIKSRQHPSQKAKKDIFQHKKIGRTNWKPQDNLNWTQQQQRNETDWLAYHTYHT